MTDHLTKKRGQTTVKAPALVDVRVMFHDGSERVDRFVNLEQAARFYPSAWRIERVDMAGRFW